MNKGIIFGLGVLVGVAAGGFAGYMISSRKLDKEFLEEIEELEDTVEKYRQKVYSHNIEQASSEESEDEDDTVDNKKPFIINNDSKITENDGVKKYHHYVEESMASAAKLFEKGDNKVTEGEKAIKENPEFDPNGDPNVTELTEDKYSDQVGEQKGVEEALTYLYPQDELYWGYGTDTQELAEKHFKLGREKIIGQTWRWATDYTGGETGVGYIYLHNAYIKKYISVEVIVDLELEKEMPEED